MKRTNALTEFLENLTAVFNDGEPLEVEFASTPHANFDGSVAVSPNVKEVYGRNLSGPDELRVIVDTLSHEVEHVRESDLEAKKAFMEQYPEAPQLAGLIHNVLEDHYIDLTRTTRFKGLRKSVAFKADAIMANHHRRPRIDNLDPANAVAEGFLQMALCGRVKGFTGADDDVRTFLAWARTKVVEVRTTHDPEARDQLAHEVTQAALAFVPDPDEFEAAVNDMDLPTEGTPPDDELDFDDEERPEIDLPENLFTVGPDTDDLDFDEDEDEDEATVPGDGEGDAEGEGEPDEGDDAPDGEGNAPGDGDEMDTEADEAGDGDADAPGDEGDAGDETEGSSEGPGDGDTTSDLADGGNGPTSDDSDWDAQDLEDALDELDELTDDGDAGDWFDADDYDEADDSTIQDFERIRDKVAVDQTPIGKRKKHRDNRRGVGDYTRHRSERIREHLNETGQADAIARAFRKLKTRDHDYAARSGKKVNLRNAIRRQAGDYTEDRLYTRTHRAEIGDRTVGASLDISASVDLFQAKVSLGALAIATNEIGDEFCATGWGTYKHGRTHDVKTPLITAPDEKFDWDHVDSVNSTGWTPTPSGIADTANLLETAGTKPDKVMFVITDGDPNITPGGRHSERTALSMATNEVAKARAKGITVIGLGVGGGVQEGKMETMFGRDGYIMVDTSDLTDALIRAYSAQMKVGEADL